MATSIDNLIIVSPKQEERKLEKVKLQELNNRFERVLNEVRIANFHLDKEADLLREDEKTQKEISLLAFLLVCWLVVYLFGCLFGGLFVCFYFDLFANILASWKTSG
jgi:hypothetical protein